MHATVDAMEDGDAQAPASNGAAVQSRAECDDVKMGNYTPLPPPASASSKPARRAAAATAAIDADVNMSSSTADQHRGAHPIEVCATSDYAASASPVSSAKAQRSGHTAASASSVDSKLAPGAAVCDSVRKALARLAERPGFNGELET